MIERVSTAGTHIEKLARQLWCPFARAWSENGAAYNRTPSGDPSTKARCITVECMAWQWLLPDEHGSGDLGYCRLIGREGRA